MAIITWQERNLHHSVQCLTDLRALLFLSCVRKLQPSPTPTALCPAPVLPHSPAWKGKRLHSPGAARTHQVRPLSSIPEREARFSCEWHGLCLVDLRGLWQKKRGDSGDCEGIAEGSEESQGQAREAVDGPGLRPCSARLPVDFPSYPLDEGAGCFASCSQLSLQHPESWWKFSAKELRKEWDSKWMKEGSMPNPKGWETLGHLARWKRGAPRLGLGGRLNPHPRTSRTVPRQYWPDPSPRRDHFSVLPRPYHTRGLACLISRSFFSPHPTPLHGPAAFLAPFWVSNICASDHRQHRRWQAPAAWWNHTPPRSENGLGPGPAR